MRPFFSFFGGKWRVAPRYPRPRHLTIVEPFAGSAGYATRHYRNDVRLYDKDPAVCGVWDYLIHATPRDVRSIPVAIDHVAEIPDGFGQEVRWLVGFWLNSASATPHLSRSTWARQHPEKAVWSDRIRERLATQVAHIRHWTITQASYEMILPVEATWFVDPPYVVAGRSYRCSSRDIDYRHLGSWCWNLPGHAIVCENEGADWLPFRPFGTIKAANGRGRVGVSREVVWTNPDGYVALLEAARARS